MRLSIRVLSKALNNLIDSYSQQKQIPVSLRQLTAFGRNPTFKSGILSWKFLSRELPVRLAHMTKEIDSLPSSLLYTHSVQKVRDWYIHSFQDLVENPFPSDPSYITEDHLNRFTQLLQNILQRHNPVVTTMAQGIIELKLAQPKAYITQPIQNFLDRFYMSRIGIRMLMSQHIVLFSEKGSSEEGWVGVIEEKCNVGEVARDAARNARFLCDQYYCSSPEIQVRVVNNQKGSVSSTSPEEAPVYFCYVPSHLYYILFELLKNSLRAVVEHHNSSTNYPTIRVVISKGEEDLTIKVSDEGGGLPRSGIPHLFTYLYTTASPPQTGESQTSAPLAGFGYGLPLSRLYSRYFGGDLQLISMEGYGTDAYVYLKVGASEAGEVLPEFNANRKLMDQVIR